MTREEFVTILYRIANPGVRPIANPNIQTFDDVAPGRWSFDAIEWAYARGLTEPGISLFRPAEPITRVEMAVMFVLLEGLEDMAENRFSDIDDHPALDYILKAVEAGVFIGYPDGTFRPDNYATRHEVVAATVRYLIGGSPTDAMIQGLELEFSDITSAHWAFRYVVLAVHGYTALPLVPGTGNGNNNNNNGYENGNG